MESLLRFLIDNKRNIWYNIVTKRKEIEMEDYQKIVEKIRAILNNEDLCAEAMVSEIGELVF